MGLPQEQWHTRAVESWKVQPITKALATAGSWHCLHGGRGFSGHGCLVALPFLRTSSSRRRCSSSWLVPVSPRAAGLPAPGASATLSDITAAGTGITTGFPAGPWLVAPGLRHPQALQSPALSYLASDVPSLVPVRCHLPGRTVLRRGMEP